MGEKIKIDPKLKQDWERKLSELGLGENVSDPHEVPLEKVTDSELMSEIMKDMLSSFSALPEKLREDILEEIKKLRDAGEPFDVICERAKILVINGRELADMDDSDSDKNYQAGDKDEEDKLKKEEEVVVEGVDELIRELEELVDKNKKQEKKETIH